LRGCERGVVARVGGGTLAWSGRGGLDAYDGGGRGAWDADDLRDGGK